MKLHVRNFKNDEDYWIIREFLRRVMLRNGRREFSWHVARLDYWWSRNDTNRVKINPTESIYIWEADGGQIAAVLNTEDMGEVFLQQDPDLTSPALLNEMMNVAENHLTAGTGDEKRRMLVYTDSNDYALKEILTGRGFKHVLKEDYNETQHRRNLDGPLPDLEQTPGYTIRALEGGLEFLERCYASGLGFHDDDINIARDNRDDPQWYLDLQFCPLYRRDLDIVAIAADGSVASFCTMWFDDVSRTAYIEPVATVPAHRQKGLGKSTIIYGLHRLKRMGCKVAFVGGYSTPAHALYFSVMGPDHDISEAWEKIYE